MNKSESLRELATALSKAQMEMKNPPFDSKNPFFKSNYASLASVRDTVIPILAKYGLTVIQNVSSSANGVACSNILIHNSGEWLESSPFEVPVTKHDAQGFGSACTYSRRFSLMALMAVVGDADDDGNAAVDNKKEEPRKETPAPSSSASPASGAWVSLSVDQQVQLTDIIACVRNEFNQKGAEAAAKLWSEETSELEATEKVAAWNKFPSNERTEMKKVAEANKERTAA